MRLALILTIALGTAAGVATVLQANCLSRIINGVFLQKQSLADVQSLLAALCVCIVARAALFSSGEVSAAQLAGRIKMDLRERLAAQLMALGPAYTRGERTGELSNTLTEGVEALDAYFSQYLPQLALSALVPVTILLFVFPLDLLSGLVLLLTAPLIPIFMMLIGSFADALTRRQWVSLSRLSAHFLDVLQGLTTLKLFGRSREQIQTIRRVSERFRKATMDVLRVAFLSALVLELVSTVSTAVVAVQVGLRLLYGQLSFEMALFVLILAPEFYLPLRLLGTRFHAGVSGMTAARRIYEVLERRVEPTPAPSLPAASPFGPTSVGAVVFDAVHYAYDGGVRSALNGISFEIRPGQKVALVGPSGGGKTTVAHLLLRFIEPTAGVIRVQGQSLGEVPAATWREQVTWVPQTPYLFNANIADNIGIACRSATRAQVVRAAEQAGAHEFIAALPDGYDTVVGERGARLSGGEAQRIALARAFLKDAPLLILDEATASLDPELEAQIGEATARLMHGRMVLIIAHRLSTVERADEILVLASGRIVERGRHADLVAQNGLYQSLVLAYRSNSLPLNWGWAA